MTAAKHAPADIEPGPELLHLKQRLIQNLGRRGSIRLGRHQRQSGLRQLPRTQAGRVVSRPISSELGKRQFAGFLLRAAPGSKRQPGKGQQAGRKTLDRLELAPRGRSSLGTERSRPTV